MSPSLDLEAMVREHGPFLARALARLGVGESDIGDVCQDVFLTALRRRDDFRGDSSVRTWLYGIGANKAMRWRRDRARARVDVSSDLPEQGVDAAQPVELDRGRARAILARAIDGLDGELRSVFVLFELEELPMNEVATALGIPRRTAYARLESARARILAQYQRATREPRRSVGARP